MHRVVDVRVADEVGRQFDLDLGFVDVTVQSQLKRPNMNADTITYNWVAGRMSENEIVFKGVSETAEEAERQLRSCIRIWRAIGHRESLECGVLRMTPRNGHTVCSCVMSWVEWID